MPTNPEHTRFAAGLLVPGETLVADDGTLVTIKSVERMGHGLVLIVGDYPVGRNRVAGKAIVVNEHRELTVLTKADDPRYFI